MRKVWDHKKYQQALCKGSQASWPLSANCNNSWTLSLFTVLTCQLVSYKHFVNTRSIVTSLNLLLYEVHRPWRQWFWLGDESSLPMLTGSMERVRWKLTCASISVFFQHADCSAIGAQKLWLPTIGLRLFFPSFFRPFRKVSLSMHWRLFIKSGAKPVLDFSCSWDS